ncbi:MAG: LuxR C-terminal-related transcriptional regulator [Dermatophilaceae bacterium]
MLSAAVGSGHPDPSSAASVRAAVAHRWHALTARDECIALAVACGYRLTADPVPPDLQEASPQDFEACVRRLARQGIVTPEGNMPQLVAKVILGIASPHQLRGYLRTVVDDLARLGDDLQAVAARLVSAGLRDPRLVRALELEADGVLPHRPALAAQRFALAASVAAEPIPLRVRQAESLALAGEIDAAASVLAEQDVQLSGDHPSVSAAAVCAHIAFLSGRFDHAVSLWRWRISRLQDGATPERRDGEGALVLYGLGQVDGGDALLEATRRLRPDLTFDGLRASLEALRRSFGNSDQTQSSDAVAGMVRAAQSLSTQRSRRLHPDHPAALAAIAAVSWGDLSTAESMLRSAPNDVAAALDRSRVAALRAWTAMAAGRYREASQWADSIDPGIHRDRVWRAALDVGIARRQDDLSALTRLWVEARSALVSAAPDLFSILPLGELAIVAARMREPELARPVLTRVAEILGDAGEHSLWSAPYHWAGIQIAILADEPKALAPHASALVAMSHHSPVAEGLVGAARAWVGVLGRDVDVERVTSASRRLGEIGLAWDGARLAGHGAARAASRKEAAALLDVARDLRPAPESAGMPGPAARSEAAHSIAGQRAGLVDLTRREREVVELVLSGMTYREIGDTLFLSPKTVEHHMARIRRRSGATTRGELLRRLNATLALVPPFLGGD